MSRKNGAGLIFPGLPGRKRGLLLIGVLEERCDDVCQNSLKYSVHRYVVRYRDAFWLTSLMGTQRRYGWS